MQSGWEKETRMSVLSDTRTQAAFFRGLDYTPDVVPHGQGDEGNRLKRQTLTDLLGDATI
jgi:hypothetical protein